MKQAIQYCTTSDGARIAYSVTGQGSPIIRTAHWMTHLEHDFSSPVWRHTTLGLSRHHRLVRYDPRGEGMSQRDRLDIDFEAWMRDLEAVVAAMDLPRFALFGCSQGAATAIAYSARHPERVTHLILYGGFARGHLNRLQDAEAERQDVELAKTLIRQGWGQKHDAHRQWFASRFLPEGTAEQYRWFNRLQRVSASPEVAARHLQAAADLDVVPLLAKVRAPTLVLHCRGDVVAPFELGEEIATSIPDARFVPLGGDNHLFLAGSSAHRDFLEAVSEFLGDPPPGAHLPGTRTWWERVENRIRHAEQNWLVKVAVLLGALIGLILSLYQIWQVVGE